MDIELHLQVWNELKEHIIDIDKQEAAEAFIRVIIEHGADADDIAKYAIDAEIKSSLLEYTELEEDEDEDNVDDRYFDDLDEYEY